LDTTYTQSVKNNIESRILHNDIITLPDNNRQRKQLNKKGVRTSNFIITVTKSNAYEIKTATTRPMD